MEDIATMGTDEEVDHRNELFIQCSMKPVTKNFPTVHVTNDRNCKCQISTEINAIRVRVNLLHSEIIGPDSIKEVNYFHELVFKIDGLVEKAEMA